MNYFTKKRLLFWGIILLVIMNVSSLATVWYQQHRFPFPPAPDRPPPQRTNQFLSRELGLTDAQAEEFQELQRQHFDKARRIQEAIREMKNKFFGELSTASPDTLKAKRIALEIGEKQSELELMTFNHFLELKNKCTFEQKSRFDGLIQELIRTMGRQHKPPPGERRLRPPPKN